MNHNYLPDQGEIGPFPGSVKPARTGMYKRITKKGNVVWSWFDGGHALWGKFSSSKAKAARLGRSASKHQSLSWVGRVK